jgi:mono/diheme cytochrome c family protein
MTPHRVLALLSLSALALFLARAAPAMAADDAAIARGDYLFAAGDCAACHTDKKASEPPLSGGRALTTPFGTFYGPNITPDPDTGIGHWSEADFHRAMREGRDDEGRYMFPVFPFTSFTGMADQDIADLYAYLMSQPPVKRESRAHEVKFPFGWRFLLLGWRSLYFSPGPLQPVEDRTDEWNRGRYLAEAVVHCEECHTPRNFLGALDRDHAYAGNPHGSDGNAAPDLTSDAKDGLGDWKVDDITEVLATGITPDGDSVGEGMTEVVEGTAKLAAADRLAIAIYIKSLPALPQTPK